MEAEEILSLLSKADVSADELRLLLNQMAEDSVRAAEVAVDTVFPCDEVSNHGLFGVAQVPLLTRRRTLNSDFAYAVDISGILDTIKMGHTQVSKL